MINRSYIKEIDKYIDSDKDSNEIDELLDKVTIAYHEIVKMSDKIYNQVTAISILYFIIKFLKIKEIGFSGINIADNNIFSSFFLTVLSYLFYRLMSVTLHRRLLFILYGKLSNNSKKKFYLYRFHYFFIPPINGLFEEFFELIFGLKNSISNKIFSLRFFLTCIILIMLLTFTLIDLGHFLFYKSAIILLPLMSVLIFIVLMTAIVKNYRNFKKNCNIED